jgi:tetratricopeptide (TPR) repeat protein
MKLFRIGVLVFFMTFFGGIKAQVNLDSLFEVWSDKTQADSNRLKAMHKISWDGYLFSQPDSAFYYAQVMYDLALKVDNKNYLSTALNTQGATFTMIGNYEKALEYYEKSLKIREEKGDKSPIAASYNNIAAIYEAQGKYEKTLDYFLKAKKIFEELGDKLAMSAILRNYGKVYESQGNYKKALDYYVKSLKIKEEIGDKNGIGSSYNNIGNIYQKLANYKKALDYLLKAKKIYEEINLINGLDYTFKLLTKVYEKLGKPQKALESHKLYITIKDSLAKMDGEEQLYKFEIDKKYELEKQADSIKHADEIILHQAEAKTQKQRSNGLILISIIILVSLGLVFTQLKKVKKGKLLVEERNIVIEEKQKEITDSINYAKRLQDGILVPLDLVQS